jgi:hypothetical protein
MVSSVFHAATPSLRAHTLELKTPTPDPVHFQCWAPGFKAKTRLSMIRLLYGVRALDQFASFTRV